MIIVGLQDFAMPAAKWLDAGTSLSFIRALEQLAEVGYTCHAILREHHISYQMTAPVRGVYYHFTNKNFTEDDNVHNHLQNLRPDIVLYNCCWYDKVPELLNLMQILLPDCCHILRTHHEVRRVLPPNLATQVCALTDGLIMSTQHDINYIHSLGIKHPKIYLCPFGVDVAYFGSINNHSPQRDIDVSASCSANPIKNGPLLVKVFDTMKMRGFKVLNVVGETTDKYRETLQKSKVYFAPTLSEASGSRSLLEAIAAGAYPVCIDECLSTVDLVNHYNGTVVSSTKNDVEAICDVLEKCIVSMSHSWKQPSPTDMKQHTEEVEISKLQDILLHTDVLSALTPVRIIIDVLCSKFGIQTTDVHEKLKMVIMLCGECDPVARITVARIISEQWEKIGLPPQYQFGFLEKIRDPSYSFNLIRELKWMIK